MQLVNKSVEVYAGTVDYQTFGAVGAPETIMLLHATATGAWRRPLAEILSQDPIEPSCRIWTATA